MKTESGDIVGRREAARKKQEEDREKPPAAAERFVQGFRTHKAPYDPEWADDPHFEPPDGIEPGDRIVFEDGDTLPRALVEDCWFAFSDRIIAFDSSDNIIDDLNTSGFNRITIDSS